MARIRAVCPPGIWCLTPELGFVIGISIIVIIGLVVISQKSVLVQQQPVSQGVPVPIPLKPMSKQETNVFVDNGDDRYNRAPEPYRSWAVTPDLRGALVPQGAVPIFQPVRGYPEQFQQMGVLTVDSTNQILPLYGRRAGNRADRYNYYTRTDTYNPIQLPVHYERRDCMDDIGCQELYGGERIKIDALNVVANVKVYKYDAPRYIPAVL
jgi:hypothetical protein